MPAMSLPNPPMSPEKIAACRSPAAQSVAVQVVAETGSTNSDLLARVPDLKQPVLLVAALQNAGRGRAGRSWLSEPGASLTFSLAWPFRQTPQALLGLPLAVGVVLAETLAALDVPVQLKWPNDVLRNGRKLAGILVETAVQDQTTWAVIGIGLNLLMPQELEARIGQRAADATWLAQMDRNVLLGSLLNSLADGMEQFSAQGFAAYSARWNSLHAFSGQRVNLIDQGRILAQGTALGVNQQGCLLLQDEQGGVSPVMVGDVSLRIG